MPIRIFRTQRNLRESWLAVNDDGTVTYHLRNFGSRLMRDGSEERNRTMSASEAKSRWPFYSKSIDLAVAEVAQRRYKSLEQIGASPANGTGKVRASKSKRLFDKWRPSKTSEGWATRLDPAAE